MVCEIEKLGRVIRVCIFFFSVYIPFIFLSASQELPIQRPGGLRETSSHLWHQDQDQDLAVVKYPYDALRNF